MVRPFALSSIVAIVCVAAAPWNGALLAAGDDSGSRTANQTSSAALQVPSALTHFSFADVPPNPRADERPPFVVSSASTIFAQRGYGRGGWHNGGARAAVILGAAAAIAGAAVLVYANRPDCRSNPSMGGCGYGTKVIGGAMVAGGAVGLVVGAVSWR
ncbi:MAG: hypothetical protein ACRD1V_15825 [Vicinamibacterales bacterium]